MSTCTSPLMMRLPSDLRYLAVARSFLEAACVAHGVESGLQDDIVLAVHEAVSNVIRHAHHDRADEVIEICCLLDASKIEVHILDEGDPFNFESVPMLDPSEERIGGRGVFLMRALMDRIQCEARQPRGNRLRLVKYFSRGRPLEACG